MGTGATIKIRSTNPKIEIVGKNDVISEARETRWYRNSMSYIA